MVERTDTNSHLDLNDENFPSTQTRFETAQLEQGADPSEGETPPADPRRIVIALEDGPALHLPEGASIEQPRVNGTDLEFVQPDGTVFVVPEGAVIGLTIFIGNIEIPPLAVAALFETNAIEAAAGPEGPSAIPGSGGNFTVPTGTSFETGNAFSDLLADTTLAFGGGGATTEEYDEVNVAPTIVSGPHAGIMVESADNVGGIDADPLDVTGAIRFSDFNLADTFTTSITGRTLSGADFNAGLALTQAQIDDFLAGFSITPATRPAGDSQGTIGWRYALGNSVLDFLAAGESMVMEFVVTIDDGQTETSTTVTITVQGTNDAPVVTSQTAPFVYDEVADVTGADPSVRALESGQIIFDDVDLTDQHSVSHDLGVFEWLDSEGNAAGTLPAPVIDALQAAFSSALASQISGGGAVSWSFEIADSLFDFLADDESLNLRFDVTIDDGQGGTVTQPVHVTVNGSNDIPVTTDDEMIVPVGDFQDLAVGSNKSINVLENDTDADANDVLAINGWSTFASSGMAHLHQVTSPPSEPFAFEAKLTNSDGEVLVRLHTDGTLSISPLSGDFFANLGSDQTFRMTVRYRVTDDQGTSVASKATIYINGAGVGTPEIGAVEGAVIEAGHALDLDGDRIDVDGTDEAAGNLYSLNTGADPMTVDDVDSDLGINFTEGTDGIWSGTDAYGTLTFDPATGEWHYTLDNNSNATQTLNEGDEVTHTVTFTVTGNGFEQEEIALEITITGTNDLPSISAAQSGAIDEEILAGNDGDSYDDGGDLDPNGNSPVSGSLNVTWALDDYDDTGALEGEIRFTDAVSAGGPLTSGGEAVQLHISADGIVLTGYVGGSGPTDPAARIIFEATVDPAGNGSYTFDLKGALDHPVGGSEDDIELTFNLEIIDNEGVAQDHSFTVTINDDAPVASGASAITVDEATLDDPIDWGSGNFFENLIDLLTGGTDSATGQLSDAIDFGADGAHADASFIFTDNLSGLPQDLEAGGKPVQYGSLEINGETVIIGLTSDLSDNQLDNFFNLAQKIVDGTANFLELIHAASLVVSADFNPVFSLRVDEHGDYTFRLFEPLDHAEGADNLTIDFSALFEAMDADGDAIALPEGAFTVTIADDMPLAGNADDNQIVALDDDTIGSPITGTLIHDGGADGLASIQLTAPDLPAGFTHQLAGDGTTITILQAQNGSDVPVLEITLDPQTGAYTATQLAAIRHSDGNGENDLDLTLGYSVTDGDDDTADGSFTVRINDDVPTATGTSEIAVHEAALDDPIDWGSGNLVDNLVDLLMGGVTGAAGQLSDAVDFGADGAHADASFVFTGSLGGLRQDLVSNGQQVQYASLDMGGETVVLGFTTDIGETGLAAIFNSAQAILDGGLPSFADALTVIFTMLSNPDFGMVFSLRVDEHGDYTFRLFDELDHPGEGADDLIVDFSSLFDAVDADGDAIALPGAAFTVTITDDLPLAGNADDNQIVALDDDDMGSAVSGTLVAEGGADGLASIQLTAPNLPAGFTYDLTDGTSITIFQSQGGQPVAVLQLSLDPQTGAYTATQLAAVRHTDGGDENDLDLTLGYSVTDGDDDTTEGAFTVRINDDVPTIIGDGRHNAGLDEDDIVAVLATQPAGTDGDQPNVVTGQIGKVDFGADGFGSLAFSGGFAVPNEQSATLEPGGEGIDSGLTSDERPVFFRMSGDGLVIEGYVPGVNGGADEIILTATLNGTDRGYQVELLGNIDHQPGNSGRGAAQSINFDVRATDGDGDFVDVGLSLRITDDAPIANSADRYINLNESDIDSGTASQARTFSIDFGADGYGETYFTGQMGFNIGGTTAGNITFNVDAGPVTVDDVTSDGEPITFERTDANTIIGYVSDGAGGTTTIIELRLNDTDTSVTATLLGKIDHLDVGSGDPLAMLRLDATVGFTDGDGDPVTSILRVNIHDDGPTTTQADRYIKLYESDLEDGTATAAKTFSIDFGADGYGETYFTGQMGFNIGGTTAGNITFNVDAGPVTVDDVTSGGEPITFERTDANTIIGYVSDGAGGTTTVIELRLNDTDTSVTATLLGKIDHLDVGSGDPLGILRLDATVGFTDGDGDPVTSILRVEIYDDTPTASPSTTVWLDDEDLTGGIPGGIGDQTGTPTNATGFLNHNFGADAEGASISWLPTSISHSSGLGFTFEVADGGATLLIKQDGELVVTATVNQQTGAYTVTQNAAIRHPEGGDENEVTFQLKYEVRDGDGDTAQSHLWVKIDDDTPTASPSTTVWLDDEDLTGGIPGGIGDQTGTPTNATGFLNHNFGADAEGASISWLSNSVSHSSGLGFTFEVADDGATLLIKQDGELVVTATVNQQTGAYTVTQNAAIRHPEGGDENEVTFQLKYEVRDGDGDTAQSHLWVKVDDDTPTASPSTTVWLDDEDLTGGIPGGIGDQTGTPTNATGFLNHNFGADAEGATISWLPTSVSHSSGLGFTFEVADDGATLLIKQDGELVVTATVNQQTGAYTVTQNAAIRHPEGGDENEVTFQLKYEVRDGDGDTAQSHLWVKVDDDTPIIEGNGAAPNLLTNGDFSDGMWSDQSWGGIATDAVGWQISGTAPGQAGVQLEYVNDGYMNMSSSTGETMVDLAASPGNVAISQTLAGLDPAGSYTLSFEIGSPQPGSAGLEVYWNGEKLNVTFQITAEMTEITLTGLVPDADGKGVLTFREVGSLDNTGTYLANVSLTPADAADLPVVEGQMGESAAVFDLTEGTHFQFGADGTGQVTFDTDAAVLSTPSATSLGKPDISYDQTTGKLAINPGWGFVGLSLGEIATLTIPFSVTDADGDVKTGFYRVTITGSDSLTDSSEGFPEFGTITEYAETHPEAGSATERTWFDEGYNGGGFHIYDDQGDSHQIEIRPQGDDYLGHITAEISETTANDGAGFVTWRYHVSDAELNPLAEGETREEEFQIVVSDQHGNETIRTIKVTLVGTNDSPVITIEGGFDDQVTEAGGIANAEAGDPDASGKLAITDIDAGEAVFADPDAGDLQGTYGAFSFDPSTGDWTYTLDNDLAATQALAAGQTVTETLTVKSADGTESHDITVTVTGTNDGPIAKDFVSPYTFSEDETYHLNFGAIPSELVSDVDTPMSHFDADAFAIGTVSIDGGPAMAASDAGITVDATGNITIDTSVEAYQHLAQDQTVDVIVNFTVTDDGSLSDSGTVTFAVTGTNDGPIAKDFVSPYTLSEDGTYGFNFGAIPSELVSDVDTPMSHFDADAFAIGTVSIDGGPAMAASDAGITVDATGNIAIDTGVEAYQHLAQGETVDVVVNFTVTDDGGLSDNGTVTFAVTGTNDVPVATNDTIHLGFGSGGGVGYADTTPVIAEQSGQNNGNGNAQAIDRNAFKIATNADLLDDSLPSVTIEGQIIGNGNGNGQARDKYSIELKAGERIIIDLDNLGSHLHPILNLFHSNNGNPIISNSSDFLIDFTATIPGTYYIEVDRTQKDQTGEYDLNISIDNFQAPGGTSQPITFAASTLLANDYDIDQDAIRIVEVNGTGVQFDEATGLITVAPGVTTFTYTIEDSANARSTATVTVEAAQGVVEGGDGDNILIGGNGDDFLVGGAGDDILIGGLGNDTLTGGDGSDTFIFAEMGSDNVDTITDYVLGEDEIDLSALLGATFGDDSDIDDFVQVTTDGTVQVDTSGNGNFATGGSADVALLEGIASGTVTILIDDDEYPVTI